MKKQNANTNTNSSIAMFTTLANALKRVNGAAFAEAAAYAAIMDDAVTFDAVALRRRFGDACVTKKAAIAATYEAAGMASPNKSTATRLLTVGRMVNVDIHIFDGLSFIAAYELAKGVGGDVDAARNWLASHTVRTVKGIAAAFNSGRCNVATSDDNAPKKTDNAATTGGHVDGAVERARRVLSDYFKTAIAAAEKSGDAVAIANARAAWEAAVVLGCPVAIATENTTPEKRADGAISDANKAAANDAAAAEKRRRRSEAAKKGAVTRRVNREAAKTA